MISTGGGSSTQHRLNYYKEEALQNKLGSIDLEDCVKIQSSLDSACYQYLFALHTASKKVLTLIAANYYG